MSNAPYILALDISSTRIGLVFYHGAVLDHAEWHLTGDIAERCRLAYSRFHAALERYPQIDCLAIESPVMRFAGTIQQCRVAGAILALAGQRHLPLIEVAPAAAKLALAGKGNCSKDDMQAAAKARGVLGEHSADALGVALAALKRVSVVGLEHQEASNA
jgi:Holliday junction resolvasome RuvABC endonuclease subunit